LATAKRHLLLFIAGIAMRHFLGKLIFLFG